jgi:hypothetical protein
MGARGVLGSVISQGLGVATGLQSRFSWSGVAAAGVGAGVGARVGAGPILSGMAGGLAGAAATSLHRPRLWRYHHVATALDHRQYHR